MTPTLAYAVFLAIVAVAIFSAARAVSREGRRRRQREQAQVLREHPELLEIAANTWHR